MKFRFLRFFMGLCLMICIVPSETDATVIRKSKLNSNRQNTATVQAASEHSVLPKKGDIAVVVDGDDTQHVKVTEAMIVDALIERGYRVVDEAKMKKIRAAAARAKAARLALEGNVEGILKISSGYNAAATIVATVRAGQPKENEFHLYTGTASVVLMAVKSNGTKLGGKTAQGKQVGYTEDETQQKAIYAAVEAGMAQMF